MRISLYIVIFACFISSLQTYGQKKNNKVLVYGTIRNYRNVIEIEDNDYTQPLQIKNNERSFVPDNQGRFSIEFTLNEPKYFRIARNSVYVCPGDKLEADIDYNDARNATFKGSHSQENEYLKFTPYPKAGSFLEGGTNVKATIEQTIQALLEVAEQKRNYLSTYKNLSPEFKFLEYNRINADLLNSFYSLYTYFPYVHKLQGDSLTTFHNQLSSVIDSYAKKYIPISADTRFLKLEAYRDRIYFVFKLTDTIGKDVPKIKDWLYAKEMIHEMQTDSNTITVAKIRSIKTPEYRNEVLATYKKLQSYNGNNAMDVVFADDKGNAVKLSSFKGKNIYIDVWATWCGPCIRELPYLDSLKERYKNNPDIVFLSLSIDRDTTDWIRYLNNKKLTNFQYIVDLSKLEQYYVSEIPRTILIDKNFKVYAMRGPMPSESNEIIEKMLNINKKVFEH